MERMKSAQIQRGQERPWIEKDLIKVKDKGRQKVAKIAFDASFGEVEYRVNFKRRQTFKRQNAFYLDMKSTIERVRFLLDCGEKTYSFDYQGLQPKWQAIVLPFKSFDGFTQEEQDNIQALRIIINGDEWPEDQLEGEYYLDNLRLLYFHDEELSAQIEATNQYRYIDPANFIREMYKERSPY